MAPEHHRGWEFVGRQPDPVQKSHTGFYADLSRGASMRPDSQNCQISIRNSGERRANRACRPVIASVTS